MPATVVLLAVIHSSQLKLPNFTSLATPLTKAVTVVVMFFSKALLKSVAVTTPLLLRNP